MNRWIGGIAAGLAVIVAASVGFACDKHEAAGVKDTKAVAANADQKNCDMPCCAHAKNAVAVKTDSPKTAETPCAAHDAKACPKKTTAAVAKVGTVTVDGKIEPAVEPGTNR